MGPEIPDRLAAALADRMTPNEGAGCLRRMARATILIHMKTTLNLDDELLAEARRLSRIEEKTALVHAGLRALIARESAHRLAALGGTEPAASGGRRRRPRARRSS